MSASTSLLRAVRCWFAAWLSLPLLAGAASVNATITKDAMVKERFVDQNFGADTQLQVSAQSGFSKRIYIEFSVGSIPVGSTGISAQLKLRCTTGGSGRSIAAHSVTPGWSGSTINWTNKPGLGATLSTVTNHPAGSDSVWSLGALVNGNGTYSVGLDTTFSGDTTFSSKEGANDPVVVVTYTPPATGSVKIIVTGDLGGAGGAQVKSLVQTYYNDSNTVAAMTAGDNAYNCGSLSDFKTKFDPNWGAFLKRPAGGAQWVFPGTGHHDWGSSGVGGITGCSVTTPANGFGTYMSNKGVPQYGAGQWYYAYNIPGKPWRLIHLSGTTNEGPNIITADGKPLVPNTPGSAQHTWFKNQLIDAQANHIMVVAVWSDPYYGTKDNHHGGEAEMKPFWDLLYQYRPKAAIVVNGHKHNYERFAPQDNNGNAVANGIVEVVSGTGGNGHYAFSTPIAANSLFRNATDWGVTELTLGAADVRIRFISSASGFPVRDNVLIGLTP